MVNISKPFTIVIAEDDEDDYLLTMEAFKEAGVDNEVCWVQNGEELMNYMNGLERGKNGDPLGLILLDLNMPKKDGREVLHELKSVPKFRHIPVVVMTTSKADADIVNSYELGVNSFIQKPVRFQDFVKVIKVFSNYWFGTVKLPL
ncbi:chemotaxis protein CheY [Candidatus Nitromaritima sp. SCGC AAA799-A02]|nr:chemotaxis protein CheY [Candidatus Nitromaritima sp. SCGC AAA799-C22]KMP11409.1 chemotaxis protein CheY [Candidatus Nitromaritima sp. SCGC AAA799-A02]